LFCAKVNSQVCVCFVTVISNDVELRKSLETEEKEMPMSKEWLTLRDNKDDWYNVFFDLFVINVVGAAKFRSRVVQQFVSSFVTISDEAFALLVLENCEEKWMDMYEKKETRSDKKNKYTDGGKSCKSGRSRNLKGWSNRGLNRFNELYRLVKSDRERKDVSFEGSFLELMREKYQGRKKRKLEVRVYENDDDETPAFIENDAVVVQV
jgi:hypothetical protein